MENCGSFRDFGYIYIYIYIYIEREREREREREINEIATSMQPNKVRT